MAGSSSSHLPLAIALVNALAFAAGSIVVQEHDATTKAAPEEPGADQSRGQADGSPAGGQAFSSPAIAATPAKGDSALAGVGVNGFWYQQLNGDSSSGATYGDFQGSTTGLGPVLSYAFKLGKVDMIAEMKWLHELDTIKRLEGDIVWFKLVAKF